MMNRGPPQSKDFARARLQAADELRRNGKLSATARLVGLEIFSCINRVNGQAYPSEQTIASRLGIADKTVKRAIAQLQTAGYIKVTRRGRNNVYSPSFIDQIGDKKAPITNPPNRKPGAGDKNGTDRGHFFQNRGQNDPPNSITNPVLTLRGSLATAPPTGALRSPQVQARQKTENEIAKALGGWPCFMAVPLAEAEDLRKRWPNVKETKLLELKRKYAP